jgi:hypothetical protein
VRILTWNLERARYDRPKGRDALAYAHSHEAEVVVVTEGRSGMPPGDGHVVWCRPLDGPWLDDDERRVVMWSRRPWSDIDDHGSDALPSGRFVSARTDTSIGSVRVVGVCIPWPMARVATPPKDRRPWQEHITYCLELPAVLGRYGGEQVVVAGDFNQRVPRAHASKAAAAALESALAGFEVVTAGIPAGCDRQGIDHIALGPGLRAERVWGWPNVVDGRRFSDHDGVGCDLSVAAVSPRG